MTHLQCWHWELAERGANCAFRFCKSSALCFCRSAGAGDFRDSEGHGSGELGGRHLDKEHVWRTCYSHYITIQIFKSDREEPREKECESLQGGLNQSPSAHGHAAVANGDQMRFEEEGS